MKHSRASTMTISEWLASLTPLKRFMLVSVVGSVLWAHAPILLMNLGGYWRSNWFHWKENAVTAAVLLVASLAGYVKCRVMLANIVVGCLMCGVLLVGYLSRARPQDWLFWLAPMVAFLASCVGNGWFVRRWGCADSTVVGQDRAG